ncbi:MAG: hypothetical protein U1E53_34105 [Dongiaceae bacterium]
MATKIDKVIVTNLAALRAKYGAAGLTRLQKAVNALVAADRGRGLVTQLVGLDDKTDMGRLSATPVTDPADARQNKTAIDAVYRGLAPDYLMLLGAVDVIPHQDLKNPLYTGGTGPEDDVDPLALGDLPYACEAAYSQAITSFLGPTRVVGRLPDVTGATDPAYLLGVLETCAGWTGRDRSAIAGCFAVTAQVWQASSRQSTANIFGSARDLQSVPPKGRPWPAARLRAPVHFFNCHGAKGSPQFFGQPASGAAQYPVALDSADLAGRIGEGTVAAAECCYGAELYGLSATRRQMGICNSYLENKAYGFLGSSTIAYGPASGNGQADLICQYFLGRVLAGSSLGRATLEARQRFVQAASPLDPSELKTLAQFSLLGDPSITPVTPASPVVARPKDDAGRAGRQDRRRALFSRGLALAGSEPKLSRRRAPPPAPLLRPLEAQARELGLEPGQALSFDVRHRPVRRRMPEAMARDEQITSAYHVLFAHRAVGRAREAAIGEPASGVPRVVLLVGKEVDGRLVSVEQIHSR